MDQWDVQFAICFGKSELWQWFWQLFLLAKIGKIINYLKLIFEMCTCVCLQDWDSIYLEPMQADGFLQEELQAQEEARKRKENDDKKSRDAALVAHVQKGGTKTHSWSPLPMRVCLSCLTL